MSSEYTDEQLYLHYRASAESDSAAMDMVREHRARFALETLDTKPGVWGRMDVQEREAAILQAVKRATEMDAGPDRQALLAHAMRGASRLG